VRAICKGGFFFKMIKLKKDTTTDVALTLTEKVTITSPIYIFSFVHDLTFEVVNFILPDVSPYPERYNLFEISSILNTVSFALCIE